MGGLRGMPAAGAGVPGVYRVFAVLSRTAGDNSACRPSCPAVRPSQREPTMRRPTSAAALLVGLCAVLAFALERDRKPAPAPRAAEAPRLPGVQPGGSILLPNQWSLRPAGLQLELGDFPVNLALHP